MTGGGEEEWEGERPEGFGRNKSERDYIRYFFFWGGGGASRGQGGNRRGREDRQWEGVRLRVWEGIQGEGNTDSERGNAKVFG